MPLTGRTGSINKSSSTCVPQRLPSSAASSEESSSRCCLITGATGFVGLNLIERILTQGSELFSRILIVTRCKNGSNVQNIFQYLPKHLVNVLESRIEVIECDLASKSSSMSTSSATSPGDAAAIPSSTLHEALKHVPTIDVIFHLLHINENDVVGSGKKRCYFGREFVHMGHQPECRQLHYDLNLRCMDIIIDIASQKCAERLVYCSSWSSYGVQPEGTVVSERSLGNDVLKLLNEMQQKKKRKSSLELLKGQRSVDSSVGDRFVVSDEDLIKFVERKQPQIALSFFSLNKEPNPYSVTKHCCELKLRLAILSGRIKGGMTIQPTTILGMYSKYHWSKIFHRLLETNGQMPGIPGSTSVVDVRDLAHIMVRCCYADVDTKDKEEGEEGTSAITSSSFGSGECYLVGGENITNLGLMRMMAKFVNVPAPKSATPKWLLMMLSRWNEFIVTYTPTTLRHWVMPRLLVRPKLIGSPFTMSKICQSQKTSGSIRTKSTFGYQPTPIQDIVGSNYEWLRKVGEL